MAAGHSSDGAIGDKSDETVSKEQKINKVQHSRMSKRHSAKAETEFRSPVKNRKYTEDRQCKGNGNRQNPEKSRVKHRQYSNVTD